MRHLALAASAAVLALAALPSSAQAGEGMWTFDNFPIARVNAALGTAIDQAWLDRVQRSSVKFGGCSAGVVSGEGLGLRNPEQLPWVSETPSSCPTTTSTSSGSSPRGPPCG